MNISKFAIESYANRKSFLNACRVGVALNIFLLLQGPGLVYIASTSANYYYSLVAFIVGFWNIGLGIKFFIDMFEFLVPCFSDYIFAKTAMCKAGSMTMKREDFQKFVTAMMLSDEELNSWLIWYDTYSKILSSEKETDC